MTSGCMRGGRSSPREKFSPIGIRALCSPVPKLFRIGRMGARASTLRHDGHAMRTASSIWA
eukprot:1298401-Prymnesium_polylepis.1